MDPRPSLDLLESTHLFPGTYRIKAIGAVDDDFATRVLEAVVLELTSESEVDHTVRSTPGGRHVAVTMDLTVQTAQQVRDIYARLSVLEGLTFLF